MDYREKWIICLIFELTPCAKVICQRMGTNIRVEMISDAICNVKNAFSARVSHDGTPQPINLTDEQWTQLFDEVKIYAELQKDVVRRVLAPITPQELSGLFSINTNICTNLLQ